MRIDLHVHSCHSDGSDSPAALAELAGRQGVIAFALTDHDTVSGVKEAAAAGEKQNVRVIPGIELSASDQGEDIHILGYGVNVSDRDFLDRLEAYKKKRAFRNVLMLEKLHKAGFSVDEEKIRKMYPDSVITRAHFAEYLVRTKEAASMKEAFDRYLNPGCSCYVPKESISCAEAIACIKKAGGHPVLAHPFQYHRTEKELSVFLDQLQEDGLEGIEAVYTTHTQGQEQYLRKAAAARNLHITGGSDYHGTKKPDIHLGTGRGSLYVHHDVMNWLLEDTITQN